uniref:Prefoldin subunit 3 n=1 Tax=Clastoptera arizonana TaxID=38151 RepID=A0A1B6C182_9HEMI
MESKSSENKDVPKSYAGIPDALFMDDVGEFMALPENNNVESVLKRLDEQHSKYKFMEYNLVSKRKRLKEQIPELEKNLVVIEMLKKKKTKEFETQFQLTEHVYLKATIPPTDKVGLWLGANVMLEYTLDEAVEVLTKNVATAKTNLQQVEHDLDFLRDQSTTTEVNMARVYNWNVKKRKMTAKA